MKKLFYITFITLAIALCLYRSNNIFAYNKNNPIQNKYSNNISIYLNSNQENIIFQDGKPPFKEIWGYGEVNDIQYSPNQKWFAVGTSIGVELYDRLTGSLIKHFISSTIVNSIDFSPDGNYLIAGLNNGQLIIWNLKNYSFKLLEQEEDSINKLKYSSDENNIIIILANGAIIHRNLKSKIIFSRYSNKKINAISVNSGGSYIVNEYNDVMIYKTGSQNGNIIYSHNGKVNTVTSNDKWLVSGGIDNVIYVYSFNTKELEKLYLHNSPSAKLKLLNGTDTLFSVDLNGEIKRVNLSTGKIKTLYKTEKTVKNMAISNDASEISIVLSNNKIIFISLDSLSVKVLNQHLAPIISADSMEGGKLVITGHDDGSIAFWMSENKKTIIKNHHKYWVNAVSFHIDNNIMFSGDGMGKITMWNVKKYLPEKNFLFNQPILGIIPVSKDKILIVTPLTLYYLILSTGKKQSIKRFNKQISSFAYHKKNKHLAVSLYNGDIIILDSNGKIINKIANKNPIAAMRWGLTKGQLIITLPNNKSILLTIGKTISREEIGHLSSSILNFDDEDKTSLIWSPKGVLMIIKPQDIHKKTATIKTLGDKDKSDLIQDLENKLDNLQNLNPEDNAKIYLKLAQLYESEGEYDKALFHFKKALLYYKQLKNSDRSWKIYNNIGVIYIYKRKFNLAVNAFKEGLSISNNNPILLFNLGVTYSRWRNPKLTYYYYNKSLKESSNRNDLYTKSHVYYVLAKFYYRQNEYSKAKSYLLKCLTISKNTNPYLYRKCKNLMRLIKSR
ncbi:MAG: tetratricopeptide repeat protein [Spirochaetota bacterium]|nr:tetratricopeptide repeat protein [Spirochaetota bacterium]